MALPVYWLPLDGGQLLGGLETVEGAADGRFLDCWEERWHPRNGHLLMHAYTRRCGLKMHDSTGRFVQIGRAVYQYTPYNLNKVITRVILEYVFFNK